MIYNDLHNFPFQYFEMPIGIASAFADELSSVVSSHLGCSFVSGVSAKVTCEDAVDVTGTLRDVAGPASESAMLINCLDPFVKEQPLGLVAVGVLPLGLQYQDFT